MLSTLSIVLIVVTSVLAVLLIVLWIYILNLGDKIKKLRCDAREEKRIKESLIRNRDDQIKSLRIDNQRLSDNNSEAQSHKNSTFLLVRQLAEHVGIINFVSDEEYEESN